jgi:putative sugar O-methyltransferase
MSYFAKIDQNQFPGSKTFIKKLYLFNYKNYNFSNSEKNIIQEIIKFQNLNYSNKFYGGTWEWIDKEKRNISFYNLFENNKKKISSLFSNFFRNSLSFGLISSHWDQRQGKRWRLKLASDILKNIVSWEEFTKKSDQDYKLLGSKKNIGNPYGLMYKRKLVLLDTPRHDYYANKIQVLLRNSKTIPIILEVGGGYGGLFSQLIKRNFKFKYINIDLPKTLSVAYYYIKKNFNLDINFAHSVSNDLLLKNDYIFIPYQEQNFWNTDKKINVLFNSNSFSEMSKYTLNQYFNIIEKKIKPDYILHQNTNIKSFKKLKKYKEIPASYFPINFKRYELVNFSLSIFQGGSGRYREYLFKKKI